MLQSNHRAQRQLGQSIRIGLAAQRRLVRNTRIGHTVGRASLIHVHLATVKKGPSIPIDPEAGPEVVLENRLQAVEAIPVHQLVVVINGSVRLPVTPTAMALRRCRRKRNQR